VTSPRRGPRPGYTLEEVVRTAIKLADKHGISALSLPSIAARLGLSRNALYRYVLSKDELLVVIYDAAWGRRPGRCFAPKVGGNGPGLGHSL
jgi:AcrR family transcriptional regulator